MLILLPPSVGKATVESGTPVDLERLSLPELTAARREVVDRLVALCADDAEKAREVLGLSAGQAGEVAKNAALRTAPAIPAGRLYTGVLYAALDLQTLSVDAKRRAARRLLIFSGLWGATRITDEIPSYRCSANVRLPGLGGLAEHWRTVLADVLPAVAGTEPILDLRSSAYAAMWRPTDEGADRTVVVRVLHATVQDGVERRSVVSHANKASKGRLVRGLLESGASPRTPEELRDAIDGLGYVVEGGAPERPGRPWRLDVVVTEL